MSKADVIVGAEAAASSRRRWSTQDKRRIVEEALAPGASIARVARTHDVNANQVHSWRRLYERGLLEAGGETATLLPVRVVKEQASRPAALGAVCPVDPRHLQQSRRTRAAGVIQIETERGRLRIEGAADPLALRVALECLLG